jgi:hypothetical protein
MRFAFLMSAMIFLMFSSGCNKVGSCFKACLPCHLCEHSDVDFEHLPIRSEIDVDMFIFAINTTAVKFDLDRKHPVVLDDSRIFYDENKVNKIWLRFVTQDICELWDARKLMVNIVETYLNRLNDDEALAWFAPNGRFTDMNIDVSLVFESFFGKYVDPLYVNTAILQDGDVYYYAYDVYTPNTDVWHQRFEPYRKARLLVDARSGAEQALWERKRSFKEKANTLFKIKQELPDEYSMD